MQYHGGKEGCRSDEACKNQKNEGPGAGFTSHRWETAVSICIGTGAGRRSIQPIQSDRPEDWLQEESI